MKIIGVSHEAEGEMPRRLPQTFLGVPLRRKTRHDLTFDTVARLLKQAKAGGTKRVGIELPNFTTSAFPELEGYLFLRLKKFAAKLGMEVVHLENMAALLAQLDSHEALIGHVKQEGEEKRLIEENLERSRRGLPERRVTAIRSSAPLIEQHFRLMYLRSKLFAREARRKRLEVIIAGKDHAYHLSEMFPSAELLFISKEGKLHAPTEEGMKRANEQKLAYEAHRLRTVNRRLARQT